MSLKERIDVSKVVLTAAKIVGAGFLAAIPGIAGVTARHHRELTHRSLELDPALEEWIDREMRTYAPTTEIWAAVHRLHHHFPDTSLYAIWKTAGAIKQASGIEIPNHYPFLDRFAVLTADDIVEIGDYSDEYLKDRLGGTYEPPSKYSKDQLRVLLDPQEPRYLYPEKRHDGSKYSQDEKARILLRDPHSPALMDRRNGVRGVLGSNVALYREASHLFRDHPELMPKDLQATVNIDPTATRVDAFIEQSLDLADLVLRARNKYQPEDQLKALLAGVAINTVKLGFHIAGGNITNSLGHAGETTPLSFLQAIFAKDYQIKLNSDGTISTDAVYGGPFGRLVSWLTFDEVGGQDVHHKRPDQIAYTFAQGLRACREAPWGKVLDGLAESPYFPWINPGKGFDLKEGETRPDMPNPGVLLIQRRRAEQLRR